MDDLCALDAIELRDRLRARELSAREVVGAHLAQIARVNPAVNAVVTLVAEQAMEQARAADDAIARGESTGPLHGLPIAHKDLFATAGIRTTYGSPIYREFVPEADDLVVAREKAAGAITLGKTNTPEWGAGSQTFNPVFGTTLNPYDLEKTCGGSSGGAAVALACRMVPLADGSDVGGSLRNPAAFCNVVGLRPSPGTVPGDPGGWNPLGVSGPMARSVRDVALLLSVQAGFSAAHPLSDGRPGSRFATCLDEPPGRLRVAWSHDLGGLPVEPEILAALAPHVRTLGSLGWDVEEAEPDFSGADRAFEVFRAHAMATAREELFSRHRDQVKATALWNFDAGMALQAVDLREAERLRAALFARVHAFFQRYDLLVAPVTQALPFSTTIEYPASVAGQAMASYIEWMRSCSRITMTAHPAISLPAGFTAAGLPVGIQLIGPYRGEDLLLRAAAAFEAATRFATHPPAVAISS